MGDWNEQSAPNNNLPSATIRTSKLVGEEGKNNNELSHELSSVWKKENVINKLIKPRPPGIG